MALLACGPSALAQSEAEIRDRLVGTWRLVSTEETLRDGSIRPMPSYGPRGKGFLMYQRDGHMCVHLANPDLPKWVDPAHPTQAEKAVTFDGLGVYCGRYEIDVEQMQIVHLPELAPDPEYVGSRQIRPYTFDDGRLVLGDVGRDDPEVVRWKIVWEKVR
jgi:hypothetical protein